MIKTETLTANAEKLVEVKDAYAMIENRGTGTVYASKKPDISAGADGVLAIDAGNAKVLRNVDGKIYVKSNETGIVEIQTANDLHFFKSKTSKGGGGGEPVDAYTKSQTDALLSNKVDKATGKSLISDSEIQRLSSVHNYDDTALQTAVASKISSTDYATDKKGGTVKVASVYGIDGNTENSHTLGIVKATDAEIEAGTNIRKPIVPANLSKAMSVYGINSKNDISDIKNAQTAENLLVCPYAWVSGYDGYGTGVVPTYDDNGVLYLNGSRTTTNKSILFRFINSTNAVKNIVELDADIYTLTVETSDFSNLKIAYFLAETYEDQSHSVNVDLLNNKTIIKIDNRNGEYKYINFLSIVCTSSAVVDYDNVSVKVILEKGNISHEYQPYKLSRQSLRDDIDALVTLL